MAAAAATDPQNVAAMAPAASASGIAPPAPVAPTAKSAAAVAAPVMDAVAVADVSKKRGRPESGELGGADVGAAQSKQKMPRVETK